MRKAHEYKSRFMTWEKDRSGNDDDGGTQPSTSALAETEQAVAPNSEHAPFDISPARTERPQINTPKHLLQDEAPVLLPLMDPVDQDMKQISSHPPLGGPESPHGDISQENMPASENSVISITSAPSPEVTTQGAQLASPHPPTLAKETTPSESQIITFAESEDCTGLVGHPDTPDRASTPTVPVIDSHPEPESWENLKKLMRTLAQASAISGLGPIKSVIEGLVELIGLYEETAQAQTGFDDLRLQLECILDELNQHLSSSPVITTSMDSICWSIQKEIQFLLAQQARPKSRRIDGDSKAGMVLECYRRIQGHLHRLARNANILTWKIVDQVAAESRLQKLASSLWECYNSQKALELKRGPCTEGTRISVLSQIHQWVASPGAAKIFWMSGMAGTGKTTIAYTLCEQLDAKENRLLCANFFCSRSIPECRDVGRIIPSIAYQLARCSQPFRYALSKATERDPDAHTRFPQLQFESLIVQPFSNVEVRRAFPRNMVVVIDALDECDDIKSTQQILDVLLTKSEDLPIMFVVSSRPEPTIRDQMEKNTAGAGARVVLHELDSREVQTDIKTYLRVELGPITPSDSEIDQLVARAGVLFIYAATVVRYVGYANFGRNPRGRLRAILAKTGQQVKAQMKDIDELYAIVLDAAFNDPSVGDEEQGDMKLILHTVICAREPLTVASLNGLLRFDDIDRVHSALQPLWSVLHVMGRDMTVATLHASFPDYLLDPKRSGAWHCDAATQNQLLARRCFDYIQDTKPQFNICRLESSFVLDKEVADLDERVRKFISTELRYACRYWPIHLSAADFATALYLKPLLSQFLSTHLLLWMEVRNLTNTFPATLGDLTSAKKWATQHDMPFHAIALLSDAWRLASTFVSSPVSQSTPHLYISMLPILPPSSPVRKYYCSRFQGLIGIEGTSLQRRQDALLAQWKFELVAMCMACSPGGTRVAIGGCSTIYPRHDRLYLLDAFSGTLLVHFSQDDETHISSVAFSPNGTRLVSGRADGVISVWDLATGQLFLNRFKAHSNRVSSITYSHDGTYIVSASDDSTIRIWDAVSGDPAFTPLVGHMWGVNCIAITSDDVRLVSGSQDRTIRVWDMPSGELMLDPVTVGGGPLIDLAISPDDSYLVSGSYDRTIRVWDMATGQLLLGPLMDQGDLLSSISTSPNGSTIASTSYIDGVRIWDATTGNLVSNLGPFSDGMLGPSWATFLPDGTRIILVSRNGSIRLLDTQIISTASESLSGHTTEITSIDISSDSQHVVSGGRNGALCVWDLAQGELLLGPCNGHTSIVQMVRFSQDGSRILSCSYDETVCQWDAHTGAVRGRPIHIPSTKIGGIRSATYSQDRTLILSLTEEGALSVWKSSNGKSVLGPIAAPSQSFGVHAEFSLDSISAIAGYGDGLVCVWNMKSGQMVSSHNLNVGSSVLSLAFSSDSRYCAQYDQDGQISLHNINMGEKIPGSFEGHTGDVRSLQFSLDSTRVVSGSADKTVHVLDAQTGQSMFGPLCGHTKSVNCVAFSPDGKSAVSGSDDQTIRVWNLQPQVFLSNGRELPFAEWVMDKDGWVVSRERWRLFWVPGDLRQSLMSPRNTMVICREGYLRLNFEDALLGEAWGDIGCEI